VLMLLLLLLVLAASGWRFLSLHLWLCMDWSIVKIPFVVLLVYGWTG